MYLELLLKIKHSTFNDLKFNSVPGLDKDKAFTFKYVIQILPTTYL